MARRTSMSILVLVPVLVCFGFLSAAHTFSARTMGADALISVSFDGARTVWTPTAEVLPPSLDIWLTVTLSPPDPAALLSFDNSLIDPSSPGFRHFLGQSEFMNRFAPSVSDLLRLETYFAGFGAGDWTVTADRFGLAFRIPVAGVESALHTNLVRLSLGSDFTAFTVTSAPELPADLASTVLGIGGLSRVPAPPTFSPVRIRPLVGAAARPGMFVLQNGSQNFVGSDFDQIFGETQLFPGSGHPSGTFATNVAVATLLWSGYNATTRQDTAPWDPTFANYYFDLTFPSGWPHPNIVGVPVTIDGVTPPPPGPMTVSSFDDESLESYLDIEMAGSMAPGATIVNFYGPLSTTFALNTSASFADHMAQVLSASLSYDYGGKQLIAVSNSYGSEDQNDTLWNTELLHASAIGVTVFASSGDQGNAPNQLTHRPQGQWPGWPATVSFGSSGVVSVGGTTITASGTPTVNYTYDPNAGSIADQVPWWDTSRGPGHYAGTEGGISSVYAEPAWQSDSAAQTAIAEAQAHQGTVTGFSWTGRGAPDVAFPASNTRIMVQEPGTTNVYYLYLIGGTSVSSPIAAGMFAEMAAVAGHRFGFVAPELYRIASYFVVNPGSGEPFVDVTHGVNYVFSAASGWDATTGLGTLTAPAFVAADANPAIRDYDYSSRLSNPQPLSSSVGVLLAITAISVAVLFVLLAVVARGRRRRGGVSPASFPYPPGTFPPTTVHPGQTGSAQTPWPYQPPVGGPPGFQIPPPGAAAPPRPAYLPSPVQPAASPPVDKGQEGNLPVPPVSTPTPVPPRIPQAYCTKCGTRVVPGANFCRVCGSRVG